MSENSSESCAPETPGGLRELPPPEAPLPDPRSPQRTFDIPPLGGHIKERPEDFLVDELPLYEPSGTGEHLYLRIGRRDMPHHEMLAVLRAHFGVSDWQIGFAGIKDRAALISQTVSIHLPHKPPLRALQHERMQVLWAAWHANKLRRGHLAGNRFSIRIRGVQPTQAPAVWRALQMMSVQGVPGYFGAQRFGMRANGHTLGRLVLREAWPQLLAELLGTAGAPFPDYQRAARELAQAGRWKEAFDAWPRSDRAERAALRALAQGASAQRACRTMPRDLLAFWVSAWQSAVFNRVLDQRVQAHTLHELHVGDVAYKHRNGACFRVEDAAELAELNARAASFEISATALLPGHGALPTAGMAHQYEAEAICAFGMEPEFFARPNPWQPGVRRPLRVRVGNPQIEGGADEHGLYLRVAFDLPAGAFATTVLQQLGVSTASAPEQPTP